MLLYVLLILLGLLMLLRPNFFWLISERWKSGPASEPSVLYQVSTRIGGAFCLIAGAAAVIATLLGLE